MVRAYPLLEERARLLRGQSVQQVGPQGLLYVQQRELAVTSPKDDSISILGSDDATTCHIVVLRHTELNDREENENHFPIIYGIAVNIKTAEIYRASFQDRGPEEQLRAARALAGGPMISIYDAKTEQLQIGPYSWTPFPHVDFWLQQDDKQI
ncbi:Protein N-terminal asparagine amidohydrolase [Lemmus lemmus]